MRLLSGLLPLLCSLLVVHLCSGNSVGETVKVFKNGETKVLNKGDNKKITENTEAKFNFPAFVGGVLNETEFLAVICGASTRTASSKSTHNGVVRTRFGTHNEWSTAEIFTDDTQTSAPHSLGNEFTAVMNENKIYVLAKGFFKDDTRKNTGMYNKEWEPLLFVGTVTALKDSSSSGASITWDAGKSIKDVISNSVSENKEHFDHGGVGNSIVTKSGAIVFPIRMNEHYSNATSSIMYSIDHGSTWIIGEKTEYKTNEGSLVEWGDGKLLLIVSSEDGFRKVFETKDMGGKWEESLVFSRVWGNLQGRKSYGKQGSAIKVPVDGGDVLFFAHPLTAKGGSSAETLQLWISDGQRIVQIGTISDSEKEDHTGNSILAHVGGHLYITHEINPNGVWDDSSNSKPWSSVIGFTPLSDFFESAKETVRKWHQIDRDYQNIGINTSGLVGVLGNTKDDTVWTDMYNCVNATVNNGKSVSGGFRFDGKQESGAQWPVESQGQNQVYIFAEKQFTLAATVIIHTADENGEFSLIGASLDSQGNNVLFGLGYTHDNKWYVVNNNDNEKSTTANDFQRETEYHVALTFANGKASVYVDGVSITDEEITFSKKDPINHFYMGGIKQSSTNKWSSCTVKNVMLFNQPLLQNETATLAQVSKKIYLEEEEETSTALPTLITEDRTSVPTTNLANIPDNSKTVSTTKLTNIPDNSKTVATTKLTIISDSSKPASTSEPKEAPVTSLKNVINKTANDTKMHKFQNELGNSVFQKDTKDSVDAAMSLSAVGWMFVICSFIVVAGF